LGFKAKHTYEMMRKQQKSDWFCPLRRIIT